MTREEKETESVPGLAAYRSLQRGARIAKVAVVVLALITVSAVFVAATFALQLNQSLSGMWGERWQIGEDFQVSATEIFAVANQRGAVGTETSPVEIEPDNNGWPRAQTALEEGHWVYLVTLVEAKDNALRDGEWQVELYLNEVSQGEVYIAQNQLHDNEIEGVELAWDIGANLEGRPLFVFYIYNLVPTTPPPGTILDFGFESFKGPDGREWIGTTGNITGLANPTLYVTLGETLRFTAVNGDGDFHNFAIKSDDTDTILAGPTDPIQDVGDTVQLDWTPSEAGTYRYFCQPHESHMWGWIVVTEG